MVLVGIPKESPAANPPDSANYNVDGTITIFIDKSKVGNPQPGDLLGAVNGRTFNTGDTPPETMERSTLPVDHTFVKGNTDNSYPPATYTVTGNTICSVGNIEPVGAVSRKTHGSAGDFDVDLPLTEKPGIECRTSPSAGNYTVVITFAVPVTVSNVTVTPGSAKTAALTASNGFSVNNSQVTVNLTNVANAQTLSINLIGVTGGANSGNVSVPMSVLVGDVNASSHTDSGDHTRVRNNAVSTPPTFRMDVNCAGRIDAGDETVVRNISVTPLP